MLDCLQQKAEGRVAKKGRKSRRKYVNKMGEALNLEEGNKVICVQMFASHQIRESKTVFSDFNSNSYTGNG